MDSPSPRRAGGSAVPVLVLAAAAIAWIAWLALRTEPEPERGARTLQESGGGLSDLGRTRKAPESLAYKLEAVDPAVDGWSTELLSSAAGDVLHHLEDLVAEHGAPRASELEKHVAPDFACAPPPARAAAVEVYGGPALAVARAADAEGPATLAGAEGLRAALAALLEGFASDPPVRLKFKLFRIFDAAGGDFTTESYYQAFGRGTGGALRQDNALWRTRWRAEGDAAPRLVSLEVDDFETVRGAASGRPTFEDVTAAVLAGVPAYRASLLVGVREWNARLDKTLGTEIFGHQGLCVGDFDGDGLEDVYLCQPGGQPNLLLLQNPDGTARDVAAQAGVDFLDLTRSALALDLDSDGDQDLVVAAGPIVVLENDGGERFTERARIETREVFSLSAADYDADGDLDLYACRYTGTDRSTPRPYYDANNGDPNVLLRNDGGFAFADATVEAGLDENNTRYSFAASWADYDADGDADLYVANDFGRNSLYRNEGGRFRDVAAVAGAEDISAGMSVAWGDRDGDGELDLYVGNMFSSAGNRITFQRNFLEQGHAAAAAPLYQRHARGNTLFANRGDGTFADVSEETGVTMGRWAWSSRFVDVDNDGREDLAIANGYLTNASTKDL